MTETVAEFGKPIRPEQVGEAQAAALPAQVIDVFNRLIASRFVGRTATVKQDDAVNMIMLAMGIERHEVFSNHYLDVEEAFRAVGWEVVYDKPAYNEDYPATFTFTRPRP
jgi:DNA repair protein RadC